MGDMTTADHPAKLASGDDEDFADYLMRQAVEWCDNPPPAPPGFALIPCEATPRHWPTYTVVDADFYAAPCPGCQYQALSEAHRGCEHAHHRAWRRWRISHWIAGQMYASGLAVSGGGTSWGNGCDGCLSSLPKFRRGRRPYLLWRRQER
jgi:hypothetical protein